jgi:DNA primase
LVKEGFQEFFQEIKAKNDIVSVISEYVTLKRSGRSLVGLCPFHSEKTPSFNVNQAKQFYYCFGCSAGGDVFSFMMKVENLDFLAAAHFLADRAGLVWPEPMAELTVDNRKKEEMYKLNQLAMAFFSQCLHRTESGKHALNYLKNRGLSVETCIQFNLGFAPAAWHAITDIFRKKGIGLEQAEALGLVSFGENGYYDRFRDRVIFPITDPKGNVIGFGGRVFHEATEGQPKYLNSPETPIFRKGNFLYGLSLAKETIRHQNCAVIVEGYLDVIQAHQAGFRNTVASLGTALTKEQAKMIKRFAGEVILAYDADTAGQHATIRGMEILKEAELTVKVLSMPPGEDPDSFIKSKGATEFKKLLDQAFHLTDFKIGLAIKDYDLNTSEGKVQAVQSAFPQIAELDSNISREYYLRQLAREIGITETSVFAEFKEWIKKNRKKSPVLDRNLNNSYTKETTEKIADIHAYAPAPDSLKLKELSPLNRAIFEAEKELLQSALQEYEKFERIKEELIIDKFRFKIWQDLFAELYQVKSDIKDAEAILEVLNGSFREVAASLIAERKIKEHQSDLLGSLHRLKKLRLEATIQNITNQINTGMDEFGNTFTNEELKDKIKQFTELKRRLPKEYPGFWSGI